VSAYIDDIIRVLTGLASLGAVIMGIINSRKIREVHISINSRMDQMLQMRGEASKAEGVAQERKEQNR
jgi:ACT domain-containing protein